MALGATDGHENGRGRARQYAVINEPPGASLTTPANSIHEAMNRRAVRRSAERPSVISNRCEYSTAAAGIRLCDWLWAFVFSESLVAPSCVIVNSLSELRSPSVRGDPGRTRPDPTSGRSWAVRLLIPRRGLLACTGSMFPTCATRPTGAFASHNAVSRGFE